MLPSRIHLLLPAALLCTSGLFSFAGSPVPEWYQVEQGVLNELTTGGLKQSLSQKKGSTAAEILLRDFDLHVRAGDEKSAAIDIAKLSKTTPALSDSCLSQMADFLIDREQWSLATEFLETFPQASPGWGYILIRHRLNESPASQKEIDAWLTARALHKTNSLYWLRELMKFHNECGTGSEFLIRLKQDISANPSDTTKVLSFIEAGTLSRSKPDFSWLFDTVKIDGAYQQFQIGSQLEPLDATSAIKFLNKSLAAKYSDNDQRLIDDYMRKNTSLFYPKTTNWEKPLRIWTKSKLAECYKQTGQMAKAQEILLELSKENTSGLPVYALSQLAGSVQQQLPNRPLETLIKKAEPENKTSVEYWLGRASYYIGRKEDANVIDAYKKALALCPLNSNSDAMAKSNRVRVLNRYTQYLRSSNRTQQCNTLWWQEYDSTSDFNYHKAIINSLWNGNASQLKANDPRLWRYLAQSPNWDYLEEHLLRSMIQSSSFDPKVFWSKAESLLAPTKPSRAQTLGWVMTRSGESKRSIPLLESACLSLKDKDKLRSCRFTLFEAYLDTSNWRQAEKIWPQARQQLTAGEVPCWLSKIALEAAKSGDKQDALRLWKAKDQIDPSYLAPLQELSHYGLKSELLAYYRQMSKDIPNSTIPQIAQKILQ